MSALCSALLNVGFLDFDSHHVVLTFGFGYFLLLFFFLVSFKEACTSTIPHPLQSSQIFHTGVLI